MILKRLMYWFCVLFVAVATFYGFFWAIPNIAVRLGVWPRDIYPSLYEIIPTLSFGQEAVFFSHVVLNAVALYMLLRHWRLCIPVFIISFILSRIDWILLGMNPLSYIRNQSVDDIISFIANFGGIGLMGLLQLLAIILMALMLQTGQLTVGREGYWPWQTDPRTPAKR